MSWWTNNEVLPLWHNYRFSSDIGVKLDNCIGIHMLVVHENDGDRQSLPPSFFIVENSWRMNKIVHPTKYHHTILMSHTNKLTSLEGFPKQWDEFKQHQLQITKTNGRGLISWTYTMLLSNRYSLPKIWSCYQHRLKGGQCLPFNNWRQPIMHLPDFTKLSSQALEKKGKWVYNKHLHYVFKFICKVNYHGTTKTR